MSIRLMELVFKLPSTIGPGERAILMPLANEARDDGHCGRWSPEIAEIAAAAGMSERSVQRYLHEMADASPEACQRRGLPPLLEITARFGSDGKGGRQKGNFYRLILPGMAPAETERGVTDCHPSLEARGDSPVTPGVTAVSPPYVVSPSVPVKTTPHPPASGGEVLPATAETTTATARATTPADDGTDRVFDRAFAALSRAWEETHNGKPMPPYWGKAVHREVDGGRGEWLAQVTAQQLQASMDAAKRQGKDWGFGRLRSYLDRMAAEEKSRRERAEGLAERDRRADAERAEREAVEQARTACWEALGAERQEEYRRRAWERHAGLFPSRSGPLLEAAAVNLAWQELGHGVGRPALAAAGGGRNGL